MNTPWVLSSWLRRATSFTICMPFSTRRSWAAMPTSSQSFMSQRW